MSRFERELPSTVRPRTASDLVAAGVSRHVLDGPRWRRTNRGYYVPSTGEAPTPAQRIVEAAAVLPFGAAIGGWAAAYAWGADLLDGLSDVTRRPQPIAIFLPPGGHRSSSPVLQYCQQRLRLADVRRRDGIAFTTPIRAATDLIHTAPTLTDAVVALDAVLAARMVQQAELSPTPGRRGAAQARQALALSREGVLSTWETRLRLLYVLELGFPTPLVNRPVLDANGRFLGTPDLLDVEAGVALEFDGQGHRVRAQHRLDNVREERFEQAGLVVVRADSLDLNQHRAQLRRRILAGRELGLTRDRARDAWTIAEPSYWLGMPA